MRFRVITNERDIVPLLDLVPVGHAGVSIDSIYRTSIYLELSGDVIWRCRDQDWGDEESSGG